MSAITLTVNEINNGYPNLGDGTQYAVDPIASLVNNTNDDGYLVQNGVDMRTFIMAQNNTTTDANVVIMLNRYFGASTKEVTTYRSISADPPPAVNRSNALVGGVLAPGETKLYGPYQSYHVNNSADQLLVRICKDDGTYTALQDCKLAAFYLPWEDIFAGEASSSAVDEETAGIATPHTVSMQVITPNGLAVTFDDHTNSSNGFIMKLAGDGRGSNGRRRFYWVRNNTGVDDIAIITVAGYPSYFQERFITSEIPYSGGIAGTTPYFQGQHGHTNIDDGEEFFLGCWDERYWSGSDYYPATKDGMWVRCLAEPGFAPGTDPGLDIAFLELPA